MPEAYRIDICLLSSKGKMQHRAADVILMTVNEKDADLLDCYDFFQRDRGIIITVSSDRDDSLAAAFLQFFCITAVIAEVENAMNIFGLGNNAFCGIDAAVCIGKY